MAKLTVAGLKKLRAEKAAEFHSSQCRKQEVQILVGMGTCGIAAGAMATLDAFTGELSREGMPKATIRQTGCMGLCHSEPTVEVAVPGMPTVIYGAVHPEIARKIVNQHLVRKLLVNDHLFDKPAMDIVRE